MPKITVFRSVAAARPLTSFRQRGFTRPKRDDAALIPDIAGAFERIPPGDSADMKPSFPVAKLSASRVRPMIAPDDRA